MIITIIVIIVKIILTNIFCIYSEPLTVIVDFFLKATI
jgi:hypothetical protein